MAPLRATPQNNRRETTFSRRNTDAKQRSAAAMQQTHRRGDTCVARNTAAPNPHARPTSSRNPPQPPTHNATGQLCRSGTGRHEWRPYELRRKTTDAKQRSAAAIVQPPQYNKRTVGATQVSPGTPPHGTPPLPIHTHTALNAQPERTLSPAETRTGVTNVPLRRQKKRHPCP